MTVVVPLSEIATSLPCNYGDECPPGITGIPVAKVSNISSAGRFHRDFEHRFFSDRQLRDLLVKEGELLVVKSSGSKTNILSGKTAYCDKDVAGALVASNFLMRLRVDPGRAHARYLWHVLNSESSKAFVRRVAGTTTYPNLKWSTYSDLPVPLPPLEEQRRIAAILDKCNDIQVVDRKRRETLERFQASYFRHLFGEPSISNESWLPIALASCSATIQTGPFGSLLHQSDYIRCGIPILNPKHIVNGVIACGENETIANDKAAELSVYQLKEGDVLLARRGEMGRCAVVTSKEDGWLCGTGSMFIRPLRDMLAPQYLCSLLSSQYMRSKLEKIAIGTTLLNLNAKIVGDLSIPVPPIDLQRRYADVLARLSKMGDMTSRSAHARSAAVASIQNRLLTAAGS